MIDDLDKSLAALLRRDLPSVTVNFAPPDGTFAPTLPATDLFLYDVRENRDLGDCQRVEVRNGSGSVMLRPPPVRLDCSYLVTAWASDAENEHLLLYQVIRVLLRYPVLPAEVLVGSLQNQRLPLPACALGPSLLQSVGEFWQAMGGRPKAAFSYTVTVAVDVFETSEAPMVTERINVIQQRAPGTTTVDRR